MRELFYNRAYKKQPTIAEMIIFLILAKHFLVEDISKMLKVTPLKIRYFARKNNVKFTGRQFIRLKKLYEASGLLGILPDAETRELLHNILFVHKCDFDAASKNIHIVSYKRRLKRVIDENRRLKSIENAEIACFVDPYLI